MLRGRIKSLDISDNQICQMSVIAVDKAVRAIERAFVKAYREGASDELLDELSDLKRRYMTHIVSQYGITDIQ